MKNITVAYFETDEVYGRRLADYLSGHEGSPFIIHLGLEQGPGEERADNADVCLVTSSLLESCPWVKKHPALMILDDRGGLKFQGAAVLYKYQSAESVYRELLAFCIEKTDKTDAVFSNRRAKLVLVMPAELSNAGKRKCMQYLRQMGQTEKILYLELSHFPVLPLYTEDESGGEGISELIYFVKQGRSNIGVRISQMVKSCEFDYLLPAVMPMEAAELTDEEWKYLTEVLKEELDYEKVILDFGQMIPPASVLAETDQAEFWTQGSTSYDTCLMNTWDTVCTMLSGREWSSVRHLVKI